MRRDITELLRATPFVPFVIHMSSGKDYSVQHPELGMLTQAAIYVSDGEQVHRCSLLHVSGVTVQEPVS